MTASSLRCNRASSTLWKQFIAIDITKTFCAAYAPHLSGVDDGVLFAEKLASLMHQWREQNFSLLFRLSDNNRGEKAVMQRSSGLSLRKNWKERSRSDSESDGKCDNAFQERIDQGVAAYYESIRVQRLMEEVLLSAMEVVSNGWWRRFRLVRVIDEVWRAGLDSGQDFLLPVTEWEAPLYYSRVKQPISIATLYCAVWDSTLRDYDDLRSLLALMHRNCEKYNGAGTPLSTQCHAIVKIGYRAARDAERSDKRQGAACGDLSGLSSLCDGPRSGGVGALCLGKSIVGESLIEPIYPSAVEDMFPPRREAGKWPGKMRTFSSSRADGVAESKNEKNGINLGDDKGKRVLRLSSRTRVDRLAQDKPSIAAAPTPARKILRLRQGSSAELNAVVSPKLSECSEEQPLWKGKRSNEGKKSKGIRTIYWILCCRCKKWRIVPRKVSVSKPDYWECSYHQLSCGALTPKERDELKCESEDVETITELEERSSVDSNTELLRWKNNTAKRTVGKTSHARNPEDGLAYSKLNGASGEGTVLARSSKRPRSQGNLLDNHTRERRSRTRLSDSPSGVCTNMLITIDKVTELEIAMDKLEATLLEKHNTKELLTKLKYMEKQLR
uniref:CW-type domain-containing protein n=1 Tax=Trypanosoma vivax (strain Y486) TaxID=1055687 RepID=G0TYR2_TRYVY|nr:conserved hypothetical protein [Trypanosoma vivax Y486]